MHPQEVFEQLHIFKKLQGDATKCLLAVSYFSEQEYIDVAVCEFSVNLLVQQILSESDLGPTKSIE
jgi:hypothetical protein